MSVKTFDRLQKSSSALDLRPMSIAVNSSHLLTLIIAGFLFSCGPEKRAVSFDFETEKTENIIGGQDSSSGSDINSTVVILLDSSSAATFSFCAGTFIKKNIILTAAHCVPENLSDLSIKMGNSLFNQPQNKMLNVLKVIRHTEYQLGQNDLALVLIQEDKNIFIKPAVVSDLKYNHKNLLLYGYGDSETDESGHDDLKGAGTLRKLLVSAKHISQNQKKFVIDQSKGFGACHGDSGGPAFILGPKNRYILAGVASAVRQSPQQADCTGQSEYTDVSEYQTWILQSIADFDRN